MTTQSEALPANNGAGTAEPGAAAPAVGTSSPAAASPGGDLQSLLTEYQKATPTPITTADFSKLVQAIVPVAASVQADATAKEEEAGKAFIAESVKIARGTNIPEGQATLVEAYIRHRVQTDQKVFDTWENRFKNPDGWKGFLTQANGELAPLLPPQSTNDVRTDVERAAAAVRNVSTSPPNLQQPSPAEVMTMNDRDWGIYKAKVEAASQSG